MSWKVVPVFHRLDALCKLSWIFFGIDLGKWSSKCEFFGYSWRPEGEKDMAWQDGVFVQIVESVKDSHLLSKKRRNKPLGNSTLRFSVRGADNWNSSLLFSVKDKRIVWWGGKEQEDLKKAL